MNADLVQKFSLEGKGAVIVGAASGIGRQAAITFAQAGARLVLADRDAAGLAGTVALVAEMAADVASIAVDVTDREAIAACAALARQRDCLDAWANVAGVIAQFPVVAAQEEELDRILSINLKGVYWGCAAAAAEMIEAGRGSIINISSAAGEGAFPELSAYSMSKAAVNTLTRVLAQEVGGAGVRVNAVAPGFVDTPMVSFRFQSADGSIDEAGREALYSARAGAAPLRRVGTAEDIALCMLYLASDASSFVTGQVVRPNGGIVMP
jgi:3-oxoacyl-[acyl-carrier protein] reductase